MLTSEQQQHGLWFGGIQVLLKQNLGMVQHGLKLSDLNQARDAVAGAGSSHLRLVLEGGDTFQVSQMLKQKHGMEQLGQKLMIYLQLEV